MTAPALPTLLDSFSPVWAAPMAGGPTTPQLVIAAARAGHFAQLAAGYLSATALAERITAVRAADIGTFGVNLFVPEPHPVEPAAYSAYAAELAAEADRFGLTDPLPDIREDEDDWDSKVAALLSDPVPVVSFTFGLPEPSVFDSFRAVGTRTVQTVTSAAEALRASEAGADLLLVQGPGAGGHSGIWARDTLPADVALTDLVTEVRSTVDLPVVAAGGIADAEAVARVLAAGAAAVSVGTSLLRATEAGTNPVHQQALSDPRFTETTLTRAFTGRPARALVNRFVREHDDQAPSGYPALHHLTKPLRTAATQAGDPDGLHLWAGTGWRTTRAAPVADILASLVP
ncbi:nitronate monooxygenase [Brevibacterium litoralis]|uniref:nitronate monooxygenase n=1 Tax=Brevibacterium litoralis TaxID=3138935 RepID=UPI0032ED0FA6